MRTKCSSALLLGGLSTVLHAAPVTVATLRDVLRQEYPNTTFTEVRTTPIPQLFEVWMGANVAYVVADSPRYFLFGRLFDTVELRELTGPAPISDDNTAIDLITLPLDDALLEQRGAGTRQLVVFSDPGCPYCKQLEIQLAPLQDIRLYIFVLPFLGEQLPVSLWCASDRLSAWQAWMRRNDERGLDPQAQCAHPLQRNRQLAERLGVQSTPTLIWADGRRSQGVLSTAQIEARLNAEQQP